MDFALPEILSPPAQGDWGSNEIEDKHQGSEVGRGYFDSRLPKEGKKGTTEPLLTFLHFHGDTYYPGRFHEQANACEFAVYVVFGYENFINMLT